MQGDGSIPPAPGYLIHLESNPSTHLLFSYKVSNPFMNFYFLLQASIIPLLNYPVAFSPRGPAYPITKGIFSESNLIMPPISHSLLTKSLCGFSLSLEWLIACKALHGVVTTNTIYSTFFSILNLSFPSLCHVSFYFWTFACLFSWLIFIHLQTSVLTSLLQVSNRLACLYGIYHMS